MDKTLRNNLHWLSVFLRLSIGLLFLVAAANKLPNGIAGTTAYYQSLFENSLLPSALVGLHATVIVFIELALGLWLLSGFKLDLAWKFSAFTLLSLAVGMAFAFKYDIASDNFVYVFLSGVGLIVSDYDRWKFGAKASQTI